MRRRALALVVIFAALPASASARSNQLWATVNMCNASDHPNEMGVRGRMPGDGTRAKMYMRFAAQFKDTDGQWKYVGGDARSGWLYAGSARFTYQEAGFTFSFDAPQVGDKFVFRGVADFQWRALKKQHGHKAHIVVVDHARLVTQAGHASNQAEPAGFSAARCEIDGPAG
jgi:hypothetical protein